MTTSTDTSPRTSPAARAPQGRSAVSDRSEISLALQQVAAIDRFNAYRRTQELAAAATARTREMRMDSARRLEVLRHQHQALVARADAQLRDSGAQLHQDTARRVVVAHRNAWFAGRVCAALTAAGMTVLATTDNGAEAVGILVAEQPDLVLVEDGLLMVPGEEVVRQAREYVPHVLVAAQTAYGDGVGRLLDAGADAVYTRAVPPHEVAASLLTLEPAGR